MRVVLIADAYPPLRSSGAVQLRDLSFEFVRQGHQVTMLVASPELKEPWSIEVLHGVQVLRLKTPKTKDVGYIRRTIGECLMPFNMLWKLRKSPLRNEKWEGIVWYSPTIFLGFIVSQLKKFSSCKSYLIIRDIFPEWAVDMGLMGKGLPYQFFKFIANYQYSIADIIGVQTPGNLIYFSDWQKRSNKRIEVLQNWLTSSPSTHCSISIAETSLAGKKIFVYAGNMGIAQGMGILLDLAENLKNREDVGFIFVGRGSDVKKLRYAAEQRGLKQVLFFDEIDPDEIPGLYAQCHVGIVSLDQRHKSHNIPGKFLSYMQSGLPVLASVNEGNDIVNLIRDERVGEAVIDYSAITLKKKAEYLLDALEQESGYSERCKSVSFRFFSSETAVRQIITGLQA